MCARLLFRASRHPIKLRADMKHVEAVLDLLQPGFNARRIASRRKYNPNPLFKKGTTFRAVLDAFLEATRANGRRGRTLRCKTMLERR
jgi:hypothetical protein